MYATLLSGLLKIFHCVREINQQQIQNSLTNYLLAAFFLKHNQAREIVHKEISSILLVQKVVLSKTWGWGELEAACPDGKLYYILFTFV